MTTRGHLVSALLLLVTVAAVAMAVWLGVTATTSAVYPPVQIGDRTVGGPYTITTVHGDRVGGATLAAVIAVCAVTAFVLRVWPGVRAASRR